MFLSLLISSPCASHTYSKLFSYSPGILTNCICPSLAWHCPDQSRVNGHVCTFRGYPALPPLECGLPQKEETSRKSRYYRRESREHVHKTAVYLLPTYGQCVVRRIHSELHQFSCLTTVTRNCSLHARALIFFLCIIYHHGKCRHRIIDSPQTKFHMEDIIITIILYSFSSA